MFLQLDKASIPMRLVYSLSQALIDDPKDVALTQALTLDTTKPRLGLKGAHGLYGSQQWWINIEQRKMQLLFIRGVIQRAYVTGMDHSDENNTIDLLLDDNSIRMEGIYVNNKADIKLFRVGCRVELVCVLDELKRQPAPDGSINYLEIPLEMAISLDAHAQPN
ncbi:hypothetical protein IGB42_04296 [Andreprevotia sp. IGB-42]|uniref:hypothetical protein n=1 Tax=Andreprevotia sp. IGB-42 TaxID=2497473 RepID=UPI001359C371|nr:hypothetical protein [Andreprevotia sp. IGB-42]KAF0811238.1 hypothetical protein IGB42_04296 [Andreprevotia sp. IGB-42]